MTHLRQLQAVEPSAAPQGKLFAARSGYLTPCEAPVSRHPCIREGAWVGLLGATGRDAAPAAGPGQRQEAWGPLGPDGQRTPQRKARQAAAASGSQIKTRGNIRQLGYCLSSTIYHVIGIVITHENRSYITHNDDGDVK